MLLYYTRGHYLEILGSWLPLVGEVQHITHTKPIVIPLNELQYLITSVLISVL